ncbi:MAG TPA: DMT family transporter [Exilispira sp.]|nr:DMT family transporter [Exilispira sp.]
MYKFTFFSEFLLLITAAIWGFAFVAQRVGMNYIKPFTYNGIRFLLGALTLFPLIFLFKPKNTKLKLNKNDILGILITGLILFIAANLQQIGIVFTSAGNAGFITGLYVIIVPFLSIMIKKKTNIIYFISAIFSFIGLYLLSSEGKFSINKGDIIVAIGAIFWAIHIMIISYYSNKINNLILAVGQFFICGIISIFIALIFEIKDKNIIEKIMLAKYPILYGGILSISVAYTLQIVGQRKAHPALASIIMSLESFFAFIGGILILKESTNIIRIFGSFLMLFSVIISQILPNRINNIDKTKIKN